LVEQGVVEKCLGCMLYRNRQGHHQLVEHGVEVLLFLFISNVAMPPNIGYDISNLAMPPNIVVEILLGGIAELLISLLFEQGAEEKCLV
jgi:hypothetical protein